MLPKKCSQSRCFDKSFRALASCALAWSCATLSLAEDSTKTAEQGTVTIRLKLTPSVAESIAEPTSDQTQPSSTDVPLQPSKPTSQEPKPAAEIGAKAAEASSQSPILKQAKNLASTTKNVTSPVNERDKPLDKRQADLSPDPISLWLAPSAGQVVDQASTAGSPQPGGQLQLRGSAADQPAHVAPAENPVTEFSRNFWEAQETSSENETTATNSTAHESPQSAADEQGECPGAPNSSPPALEVQVDDIPLDQDEHPYNAPMAGSTSDVGQSRVITDYSSGDQELREGINQCLHYFLTHPENVAQRGPWALMHAVLPFGVETEVMAGNRRVNAIGWMCYNGVCAKQRIFQPTKQGFRTNIGPGMQGHDGQFLAILAQSRVQAEYPILIGNRRYTIQDLVKFEMATCREKSELTFKLIGLSHYLHPNQKWRDQRGHAWNLEKMVAEELAQPVIGAACGGTHRLMGLSFAISRRKSAGLAIDGHWNRAEKFLEDYVKYAMSLQNSDGSFSTEWFEGRAHEMDIERQVQTTGHILEWLIFTLPENELRSPRVQQSVRFLVDTLGGDPRRDWPIGPRGHALRAMALYNQRVFGAQVGDFRRSVAEVVVEPVTR